MMYISELLILSLNGHSILNKTFRSDIPASARQRFIERLTAKEEDEDLNDTDILLPAMNIDRVKFFHISRSSLYFVASSTSETIRSALAIDLLNWFYQLLKDFIGKVDEDSVKANLTLVSEVVDEYIDYGYIQLGTTDKIKSFIISEPAVLRPADHSTLASSGLFGLEYKTAPSNAAERTVLQATNSPERERKNEIFIDVVERLTAVINANGSVQRSEIQGEVIMKCFLVTSNPVVKVSLNKDLILSLAGEKNPGYGRSARLDRCSFHGCVDQKYFNDSKILHVKPAQGQFTLMTYGVEGNLPRGLPFRLTASIQSTDSKRDVELCLKLICDTPEYSSAINVSVTVPVSGATTAVSQQLFGSAQQKAVFNNSLKRLEWNIAKLQPKIEYTAIFKLIDAKTSRSFVEEIGPAVLDFELSGYCCSGLHLLHVELLDKQQQQQQQQQLQQQLQQQADTLQKWLRYITTADSYLVKLT